MQPTARRGGTRRGAQALLATGFLAGLAAVVLWSQPRWLVDQLARRFPGCLYRVRTDRPVVALTIDDGPDPITTQLLLDELRRHSARATFFLIATRVSGREEVVRRAVTEGHELGNHGLYDRPAIRLSAREFADDLRAAGRVLSAYGPVRWARPGSGWYSQAMIGTMRESGYRCAIGSLYPFDAAVPSAGFAVRHILSNLRPGAIVVLHDGGQRGRRTVQVLRQVLPELQRRGYRVVTLGELAAIGEAGADARATS